MKCNNCGYEIGYDFEVCSACGAVQHEEVSTNTVADKILSGLKDNLFLAICIVQSALCGFSVLAGSIPIINIILIIFLWLVYANARKGTVDFNNMRCVSGTVYAMYILTHVLCVIIAVVGLIMPVLFMVIGSSAELLDSIDFTYMGADITGLLGSSLSVLGWILMLVCLGVAAVGFVINIIGFRKIHRFAKTTYQSVQYNDINIIEDADSAKNWLWIFGILAAIGALVPSGSVMDFLSGACDAVSYVLAAILVKQYILTNK